MYDDVITLRDFYYTPLGKHLAGQIRPHINSFWQSDTNRCNVILGYGIGWLPTERGTNDIPASLVSLMLARFGVIVWPSSVPGRTTLVDGQTLPLPDVQVDRLLLAHALEFDPEPGHLLDECWRVMDAAGKVLVVVPNRRGLWARPEHTPFGHGRPYTSRQLCQLLESHGFKPRKIHQAVFLPPLNNRVILRFAASVERLGERWWPALGGVLLVEAEKMLYAASGNTSKLRSGRFGSAPALAT